MTATITQSSQREDRIAALTESAYRAILERGFHGSFLALELSLWNTIREAVNQELGYREEERRDEQ